MIYLKKMISENSLSKNFRNLKIHNLIKGFYDGSDYTESFKGKEYLF